MLSLINLSKSFGGQQLFENLSLQMTARERLALIGRNGSGKSTLFKIITGQEEADSGEVRFPQNYQIAYLAQHLHFEKENILQEVLSALPESSDSLQYQAEKILFGLGFSKSDLDLPASHFSGGFQIRINLARSLVAAPQLLLLDEPTNYLDIISIRWFEDFLHAWPGELIVISHDQSFLDRISTHTAMLYRKKLRKISGSCEKIYHLIAEEEALHEKTRLNQEKKLKKEMEFIDRFRSKATKAAAVQSRLKLLAKTSRLEKIDSEENLDFSFSEAEFEADKMLECRELSFDYVAECIRERGLISKFSFLIKANERIAILGKNGKGKSTLLALMAGELKPNSGEIYQHPHLKVGYFGQTNIARLQNNLSIEEEIASVNSDLSQTRVRSLAGCMMFSGDEAQKKISVLSGGEKSRVLLAKLLAEPHNLLLLDEPTHHLDIESVQSLLQSIQEFSGSVVMVTHHEKILREFAERLIVFQNGEVFSFEGNYDEFLAKIGWQEEAIQKEENPGKNMNKQELRRARADLISEKSRRLTPLKKEMEKLEKQIETQEKQIQQWNTELLEAAQNSNVSILSTHPKQIKELQLQLDEAYVKLDQNLSEQEKVQGDYELING
ncbi:MAG: ABC-F family ATP-binding cassette domain-containing protein [Deltaproteobacteria bacterium]|nr:ABC-F family ATP-binding cassette domain-containing protein [Deltaproteobacteria bacterium]